MNIEISKMDEVYGVRMPAAAEGQNAPHVEDVASITKLIKKACKKKGIAVPDTKEILTAFYKGDIISDKEYFDTIKNLRVSNAEENALAKLAFNGPYPGTESRRQQAWQVRVSETMETLENDEEWNSILSSHKIGFINHVELPINKICVIPQLEQPGRINNNAKLENNYICSYFSNIIVILWNGFLIHIDGGHRLEWAAAHGLTYIDANLIYLSNDNSDDKMETLPIVMKLMCKLFAEQLQGVSKLSAKDTVIARSKSDPKYKVVFDTIMRGHDDGLFNFDDVVGNVDKTSHAPFRFTLAEEAAKKGYDCLNFVFTVINRCDFKQTNITVRSIKTLYIKLVKQGYNPMDEIDVIVDFLSGYETFDDTEAAAQAEKKAVMGELVKNYGEKKADVIALFIYRHMNETIELAA